MSSTSSSAIEAQDEARLAAQGFETVDDTPAEVTRLAAEMGASVAAFIDGPRRLGEGRYR